MLFEGVPMMIWFSPCLTFSVKGTCDFRTKNETKARGRTWQRAAGGPWKEATTRTLDELGSETLGAGRNLELTAATQSTLHGKIK
jgi:hypothetical protein